MSKLDIPESWALTRVGQVIEPSTHKKPVGTFTYIDIDAIDNKTQTLETPKYLKDADAPSRARKDVQEGDIVFSTVRPYLKNIAMIPSLENPIASTGFAVLRPSRVIHGGYLFNYVKSNIFLSLIEPHQKGASYPAVSDRIVLDQQIPIPPLGEQKRIVTKIESTQEKIKTIDQSVTKAEALLGKCREALLQKAFRGELVPQDPNDEPASKLLERIRAGRAKQIDSKKRKKDDLAPIKLEEMPFEIPKSWEWVRLGELIHNGPSNGIYLPQTKYGSGSPILRIDDFQVDWCRSSTELRAARASEEEILAYSLQLNDIVVNRVNSMSHLGKVALIKSANLPALYESNMMRFALDACILPEFAYIWMQSKFGRTLLVANAKRAIGQASINQQDVRHILVPLPPREEQERVIKTLFSKLQQSVEFLHTLQAVSTAAHKFKLALLNSAFSGRLVPQDPTEGSGHELLEKIRSQRTNGDHRAADETRARSKKRAKA